MDFEKEIRNRLLIRGFKNDTLINNRGLIGATIDEVILMTVKNLAIHNVSQQRELLLGFLDNINRYDYENKPFKQIVDEHLKSNNCG